MAKIISQSAASSLLKKSDLEQIRKFLEKEFKENEELREHFVEFASEPNIKKDTAMRFEKNINDEIEDVIESSSGRYDFIDYHSASRFGFKMCDILERIAEEAPNNEIRIQLQMEVLERLDDIDIDDSDGTLSMIYETILEDYYGLFEENNLNDRALLFDACSDYLYESDDHLDFIADEIEEFFFRFIGTDYSPEVEEYLEEQMDELSKVEDQDRWLVQRKISKYASLLLEIKASNGQSENEQLEFAYKYWKSCDVRKYFVEKYISQNRLEEAISLLEEGLKMDVGHRGLVIEHQEQLKELYKQTHRDSQYTEMLWQLNKSSGMEINLGFYDELKSIYTPEQWEIERENLFSFYQDRTYAYAKMLKHEGLTERLAQFVLKDREITYLLDEYAKDLPKEYIAQIISAYENVYNHMAASANKRRDYEILIRDIEKVHRITGGKELTDRLTLQWLEKYKRRPAFCEEIRKFRRHLIGH